MTTTVFTATPVIHVTDNRGLAVRTLNWNRTTAGEDATLQVTHAQAPDDNLTVASRDPRLFAAWQASPDTVANLTTFSSLTGQPLRRDSTDSGQNVTVYDAEGRPAWSLDPAGTVMTWVYDELGRPLSSLLQVTGAPAVTATAYAYGDSDTLTESPQDYNLCGVCVRQYDEGGLLTTDSVALSEAVLSSSQTFLLDAESLPAWPDDEAGRAALLENTSYTTLVQADALARTTAQVDASGHTVSMTYDISGVPVTQSLLLQGQSTATLLLTGITQSAAGQVQTETAGNGVVTTYSYEPDTLRLAGITAVRGDNGAILQSLGYACDPVGNVISVTDGAVSRAWFRGQATDGSRNFAYNALYQLISATGRENAAHSAQISNLPDLISPLPVDDSQYVNYTRSYSFDDSGNLSVMTHSGAVSSTLDMVTDLTSNRSVRQNNDSSLTPEMDWTQWFTPGGQLKTLQTEGGKPAAGYTDSTDPLAWDRNLRLQAVMLVSRSPTDAAQNDREVYQYRDGKRVRKQTRTLTSGESGLWTVSEVRYLPGLELRNSWQETVTNGSATAPDYTEQLEVVTTQAGRCQIRALHWVSAPPSGIENNQLRYGVDDNIGSMQLELDDSGQIISREEYYPFGGTAVWATRSQTEASYKVIRYSGQERDGTGLYYYGYRYYAPWLCRWVASDPAQEVDGLNLFRMVRNNPVTLRDWKGLSPDDEAQRIFKQGKKLAIEQLKAASDFLSDKKNQHSALEVYKIFFGQHHELQALDSWKKRIDETLQGVVKLKTSKHVFYNITKGNTSSTVAELDPKKYQKWREGEKKQYIDVYSEPLIRMSKDPQLGNQHVAHVVTHEISHGVLNTEDHQYVGVLSTPGAHDLTGLINLLTPPATEQERTDKQRRARGAETALENADSFTLATRYLSHLSKNPEFLSQLRTSHEAFIKGATPQFIVRPPKWVAARK